ncbi:unnamed protein product, partial [Polarella glacialis]
VQRANLDSFDPAKTLQEHRYRILKVNNPFQTSDEILLYPLEWIVLLGGRSQVAGSLIASSNNSNQAALRTSNSNNNSSNINDNNNNKKKNDNPSNNNPSNNSNNSNSNNNPSNSNNNNSNNSNHNNTSNNNNNNPSNNTNKKTNNNNNDNSNNALSGWLQLLSRRSGVANPRLQNITSRLQTVQSPEDLRIFLWKLHNAVDSSLESKYEERVLPVPAGYWPLSRFYEATEPWGKTGQAIAKSWVSFRMRFLEECDLVGVGEAGGSTSIGATMFPLSVDAAEEAGLQAADVETLRKLDEASSPAWRELALAYLRLISLLRDGETGGADGGTSCGGFLHQSLAGGTPLKFCSAVRSAINVKNTAASSALCGAKQGLITVQTAELADAMAHWLCDWTLLSRLLRSLQRRIACTERKVVESGLLQTKFGFKPRISPHVL